MSSTDLERVPRIVLDHYTYSSSGYARTLALNAFMKDLLELAKTSH